MKEVFIYENIKKTMGYATEGRPVWVPGPAEWGIEQEEDKKSNENSKEKNKEKESEK